MVNEKLNDSWLPESDVADVFEEMCRDHQQQIEQLKTHDLWEFWSEANYRIVKQYEKMRRRAASHPNTAGDQGEIDWKKLLEQWIPKSYRIVTQGRLLFDDGASSKELDLIVLKPSYPEAMLDHKYYLVSGVVAAFECKRTLEAKHIEAAIDHAVFIQSKLPARTGTPRDELYGPMILGLLAHSHSWKAGKSKPLDNIAKLMRKATENKVSHPRELIDLVCVGDLATWLVQKVPEFWRQVWFGYNCSSASPVLLEKVLSTLSTCAKDRQNMTENLKGLSLDESSFISHLLLHGPDLKRMPPVGFALCGLLEMMAWHDKSLRWVGSLSSMYRLYFNHGGAQWGGWDLSIYSQEVAEGLKHADRRGDWNAWGAWM